LYDANNSIFVLLFNVLFVMVYSSERGTTVIANHVAGVFSYWIWISSRISCWREPSLLTLLQLKCP
jgi:hypothetical protein